jgi:hypothetical protein
VGICRKRMTAELRRTRYYDDAVPAAWVRRLRSTILQAHLVPSCWTEISEDPKNFLEQVIRLLYPLVAPSATRGAEYWARCQPASSGFRFHFDRDESPGDRIVTPLLSSIIYLSNVGGPTLVFDSTPETTKLPKFGVRILPRAGRLATFSGRLLHGVLRGSSNRWPRVAMFINWWTSKPRAAIVPDPAFCGRAPTVAYVPLQRPLRPKVPESFFAYDILPPGTWRRVVTDARSVSPIDLV